MNIYDDDERWLLMGGLLCSHTIPLFKLFPGRPRGIFSGACSFLGPIFLPFFFVAYVRQKNAETATCRLAKRLCGVENAEPAAGSERRRGRREKKVAGQVREDVVTEGGRRAAEISYDFFLGELLLFVFGWESSNEARVFTTTNRLLGFSKECN